MIPQFSLLTRDALGLIDAVDVAAGIISINVSAITTANAVGHLGDIYGGGAPTILRNMSHMTRTPTPPGNAGFINRWCSIPRPGGIIWRLSSPRQPRIPQGLTKPVKQTKSSILYGTSHPPESGK